MSTTTQRPRAIVVGAGGISNAWFNPLKAEEVHVAAVVDLRLDAARAQIDKYQLAGARAYDDMHKAFADLKGQADFVVDLTIPDAHCAVTTAALKAGFHVIGEKPMASSMDQARQMVRASEETGKLYMVSQSRRKDRTVDAYARTVHSGAIGDVTTLNCEFFLAAHFGGFRDVMASPLILDMAIHHFDLARLFAGRNAVSVYAEEFNPKGSWYQGDVSAHALFEMEGNVRFAYRGSWCSEGCHTGWHGDWRTVGTAGTLLLTNDKEIRGESVAAHEGFIRPKNPIEPLPSPLEKTNMHGQLLDLLQFLKTGAKPATECHDNIQSLAMVFATIESARTGQRVKLSQV